MNKPDLQLERSPGSMSPRPWLAVAVVLALVWTCQLVVIFGTGYDGSAHYDEQTFHLPTIRTFAQQMPNPDLANYKVATTPGYHLVLATLANLGAESDTAFRLIGGQFGVALAVLIAWWLGRRVQWWAAVALSLPVWMSSYTFAPIVLALPEDAAWLGVMGVLMLALRPRVSAQHLALTGFVVALLVCVRQIHLWAAAPVWLAGWLGSQSCRSDQNRLIPRWDELNLQIRLPRTAIAGACTVPAFLIVAWFFRLWNGPVPPTFQTGGAAMDISGAAEHSGGNPATPAMILATFGLFAPAMAMAILGPIQRALSSGPSRVWAVIGGTAFGLIVSLVPATSTNFVAGRWGGLWTLTGKVPTISDRSPAMIALAVLGAGLLTAMLVTLQSRHRLILAGSILAFMAAQSANFQSWSRYSQPAVLIVLVLIIGLVLGSEAKARIRDLFGPVVLSAALGGGTAMHLFG